MRLVKDASGVYEGLCAGYKRGFEDFGIAQKGRREREGGEKEWFQWKLLPNSSCHVRKGTSRVEDVSPRYGDSTLDFSEVKDHS